MHSLLLLLLCLLVVAPTSTHAVLYQDGILEVSFEEDETITDVHAYSTVLAVFYVRRSAPFFAPECFLRIFDGHTLAPQSNAIAISHGLYNAFTSMYVISLDTFCFTGESPVLQCSRIRWWSIDVTEPDYSTFLTLPDPEFEVSPVDLATRTVVGGMPGPTLFAFVNSDLSVYRTALTWEDEALVLSPFVAVVEDLLYVGTTCTGYNDATVTSIVRLAAEPYYFMAFFIISQATDGSWLVATRMDADGAFEYCDALDDAGTYTPADASLALVTPSISGTMHHTAVVLPPSLTHPSGILFVAERTGFSFTITANSDVDVIEGANLVALGRQNDPYIEPMLATLNVTTGAIVVRTLAALGVTSAMGPPDRDIPTYVESQLKCTPLGTQHGIVCAVRAGLGLPHTLRLTSAMCPAGSYLVELPVMPAGLGADDTRLRLSGNKALPPTKDSDSTVSPHFRPSIFTEGRYHVRIEIASNDAPPRHVDTYVAPQTYTAYRCDICASGTENRGFLDAEECTPCGLGYYHVSIPDLYGQYCYPCAPGRFTNVTGATACMTCAQGTYQADWGEAACVECGSSAISEAESTECVECGNGVRYNETHCDAPEEETPPTDEEEKTPTPTPCTMSSWSDWGACSATCGTDLVQTRSRTVLQGTCTGYALTSTRTCASPTPPDTCPLPCEWGEWAFVGLCRVAEDFQTCERSRTREHAQEADVGGTACEGESEDVVACETCHQDCVWSEWSEWDACDETTGNKTRTRVLEKPPLGTGAACEGEASQSEACDTSSGLSSRNVAIIAGTTSAAVVVIAAVSIAVYAHSAAATTYAAVAATTAV
jgi:hypothetical protein